MNFFISILIIFSLNAKSELLDKIAGVFNDQVICKSELDRIKSTLPPRIEMSPVVYTKTSYELPELLDLYFNQLIMRDKLNSLGMIVTDDRVEAHIQETERRNNLKRDQLLDFLEAKNFEFEEYFEVIRESMELNFFNAKIIAPLINITEQEIKNTFYKSNAQNNTISYSYNLTDFYIPQDKVQKNDLAKLPEILTEYRKTGNLPEIYKEFETINITSISEDDLDPALKIELKKIADNQFSNPYEKNNFIHIYFIESREIKESQLFQDAKKDIYQKLYLEKSQNVINTYLKREKSNYYIQNLL